MNKNIPLVCVCEKHLPLEKSLDSLKLKCTNSNCVHSNEDQQFEVHQGIPIIISDILCDTVCETQPNSIYVNRLKSQFVKVRNIVEDKNKTTTDNIKKFISELEVRNKFSKVLVIGSGQMGSGTNELWNKENIEIHGVDIYASETVDVICDAHYLPLESSYYDGVMVQAVLEHVVEPSVVVQNIFRVLKNDGVVYAETPFMQQVHEGAYDFTRYTVLGHRYLFKNFKTIKIGGVGGASIALKWSIKYFIWALTRSHGLARLVGALFGILLRPIDYLLSEKSMFDSSSGVFFLGKKAKGYTVTHKDLISLYKGEQINKS